MPDIPTSRAMVKGLLRGERPSRPLLAPILFALGSRLENLNLREFLSNATKISSALRQIRGFLKLDGIACYFDPYLEAEALGAKVEWLPDGSRQLAPHHFSDFDELRQELASPETVCRSGRIPIACDVLQRIKVMLKDEPALMIRVTGPLTLTAQLCGAVDCPGLPALELAAAITAAIAQRFAEAGADIILLVEDCIPKLSNTHSEEWAGLIEPVVNTIRFFDALPVLLLDDKKGGRKTLRHACRNVCALCCVAPDEMASAAGNDFGCLEPAVSLPTSVLASKPGGAGETDHAMRDRIVGLKPPLITSAEDLPVNTPLANVKAALAPWQGLDG